MSQQSSSEPYLEPQFSLRGEYSVETITIKCCSKLNGRMKLLKLYKALKAWKKSHKIYAVNELLSLCSGKDAEYRSQIHSFNNGFHSQEINPPLYCCHVRVSCHFCHHDFKQYSLSSLFFLTLFERFVSTTKESVYGQI